MAEQAPGVMVHSLAGRLLTAAFPAGQKDGVPQESDDEYRRWLRGKVVRARDVNCSSTFPPRMLASLWSGRPMHWMWQRLEFLDCKGGGLLEVINPSVSPVEHCQSEIIRMLMPDAGDAPLRALFFHYELEPRALHLAKTHAFQILTSAYAQHHWRFVVPLSDVPFEIMRCMESADGRAAAVARLFQKPLRCLEVRLARKLRRLWPSDSEMLDDAHFWSAYMLFAKHALLCNMHIERLLSLVRQSLPFDLKAPVLERVCGNGFLSQCVAQHVSAGGEDPRVESLASARRAGVPLRRDEAWAPPKGQTRAQPACILYANLHVQDKLIENPTLAPADARRELVAEFNALPIAQQAVYQSRVQEAKLEKQRSKLVQEPDTSPTSSWTPTAMMGCSSIDAPVSSAAFFEASGALHEDASFMSWGVQARAEFRRQCFVADAGSIPRGRRIAIARCCFQKHFGVCAHDDADIYAALVSAGQALWQHVWSNSLASVWLHVWIADGSGPVPGHPTDSGGVSLSMDACGKLVVLNHVSLVKRVLAYLTPLPEHALLVSRVEATFFEGSARVGEQRIEARWPAVVVVGNLAEALLG
ncbi:unnamed protein product [Prorocentrum cordatum]|uniref:Uncharacterized protein n=1 Tax=Prorocentrum cordatum TaxID=2364126 RepID=A0ABN9V4D2_9DINO|nr:unnamed protein product [Polarella glacialis]